MTISCLANRGAGRNGHAASNAAAVYSQGQRLLPKQPPPLLPASLQRQDTKRVATTATADAAHSSMPRTAVDVADVPSSRSSSQGQEPSAEYEEDDALWRGNEEIKPITGSESSTSFNIAKTRRWGRRSQSSTKGVGAPQFEEKNSTARGQEHCTVDNVIVCDEAERPHLRPRDFDPQEIREFRRLWDHAHLCTWITENDHVKIASVKTGSTNESTTNDRAGQLTQDANRVISAQTNAVDSQVFGAWWRAIAPVSIKVRQGFALDSDVIREISPQSLLQQAGPTKESINGVVRMPVLPEGWVTVYADVAAPHFLVPVPRAPPLPYAQTPKSTAPSATTCPMSSPMSSPMSEDVPSVGPSAGPAVPKPAPLFQGRKRVALNHRLVASYIPTASAAATMPTESSRMLRQNSTDALASCTSGYANPPVSEALASASPLRLAVSYSGQHCGNSNCEFLAHPNPEFEGFCCKKCRWVHQSGSRTKKRHGEQCLKKYASEDADVKNCRI